MNSNNNSMHKQIKIFNSFEDAENDELRKSLSQSPIERLRQTVNLILRVHQVSRATLKARKKSNRITIISR